MKKKEISNIDKYGTKTSFLLEKVSELLKNQDYRIIIFSRWNKMLKIIEKAFKEEKINSNFVKLKGNVHQMGKSIRKFKLDPNYRVALLSSDICASGLNLTETTHIFLVDYFDENPQAAKAIENQAVGRAVRVGQTKSVQIFRLIMKNTIEEKFNIDCDDLT